MVLWLEDNVSVRGKGLQPPKDDEIGEDGLGEITHSRGDEDKWKILQFVSTKKCDIFFCFDYSLAGIV